MPAIYTHNCIAKKIYNKLNSRITSEIKNSKNLYELFSQSFDFFYYYNFLSLKKGKKYRDFGHYCHRHKCKQYFINIIEYIHDNNLENNSELLAYLYGSINHFTCDTTIHPYINYKSGRYYNKETKRFRGGHSKLEFNIDAYYYELINNKPLYKYKIQKELLKPIKFSNKLKNCLNSVYKKTFNIDNIGEIYEKSYNQSSAIFKVFMVDRFGLKKAIYKILDLIPLKRNFKFSGYSFYIKNVDLKFLNKEKKEWCHPCNPNYVYNYSWFELVDIAEKKSIKLISMCNKYFNNEISKDTLYSAFENTSYSNGLNLSEKGEFIYFEH